ncbi:MAG TPA: hypothetical protein VK961_09025 [Chthoniobacter sp.]|nr:hypothetical protein [Chthoniobacter sp.]
MNIAPMDAPSRPAELDSAPSVPRLLTAFTLITIGCVFFVHPIYNFVTGFCFLAIPWGTRGQSRAYWQRRLGWREVALVPVVLMVFFVLIVASKNVGSSALSHFFEHPIFRAALWLVISGVYLRQWLRLRSAFGSSPATVPQE